MGGAPGSVASQVQSAAGAATSAQPVEDLPGDEPAELGALGQIQLSQRVQIAASAEIHQGLQSTRPRWERGEQGLSVGNAHALFVRGGAVRRLVITNAG